jgi:hypothetical protein
LIVKKVGGCVASFRQEVDTLLLFSVGFVAHTQIRVAGYPQVKAGVLA